MSKPITSSGAILVLNDGKLVLQRRDSQAPTDANMLCTFGGHTEGGEKARETFIRELHEETDLPETPFSYLGMYVTPKNIGGNRAEHHVYMYKMHLDSSSPHFKVFEGKGAEAYKLKDLLKRDDVEPDTKHILQSLKKEKRWL